MRNLRMIGITVLTTMTWIGASVGDAMFSECRSLGGIDIPASVTEIGRYAFSG